MDTINEEDEVLLQCFGTINKYYLTSTPLMNKTTTGISKNSATPKATGRNFGSMRSIGGTFPRFIKRKSTDKSFESLPRYRRMQSTYLGNKSNPQIQEYYNNYFINSGTSEPLQNKISYHERESSDEMERTCWLSCCYNSVRFLILGISFLLLSSLFANIIVFNMVSLYSENTLLPEHFQSEAIKGLGQNHGFDNSQNINTLPNTTDSINSTPLISIITTTTSSITKTNPIVAVTFPSLKTRNKNLVNKSSKKKTLTTPTALTTTDINESITKTYNKKLDSFNESLDDVNFYKTQTLALASPNDKDQINVAVIKEDIIDKVQGPDDSSVTKEKIYFERDYGSLLLQSFVFAAPGFGILVGHFPASILLRRFGARKIMAIALLISGFFNAALPFLANYGEIIVSTIVSWLLVVFFGDVTRESLIKILGIHSAISALVLILWILIYRDAPQKHTWVNGGELNRIMTGKNNRLMDQSVLKRLVQSASTWVIWITSFGYLFAFSIIVTFMPIYIYKVLKQTVTISIVMPIVMMVFFPLGLITGGFFESAIVCGRFYSKFIISNLQISFGLALTLSPVLVFLLTIDNSLANWRVIFVIIAGNLALSAAIFCILGRAHPSSWAEESWDPNATSKMQTLDPVTQNNEFGIVGINLVDV